MTRTAIAEPDDALLDVVERLTGTYPIGGDWGPPSKLDFAPKETLFEGELAVARREGALFRLENCASGTEVPVTVALRTNDGALAESVDGTVVLTNQRETTVDGAPAPFQAQLSAAINLGTLSGSFTVADDPNWIFGNAALRAEITPFGTRGTLTAYIEPKRASGPGTPVTPYSDPLLSWHGGTGCSVNSDSQPELALYPAPTPARAALDAARDMAAADTYRAVYSDGTETRVALEIEPLSLLCAANFGSNHLYFPTNARLRTDDGRLNVSIPVAIDPGYALLHFNQRTDVPWAYPPASVSDHLGHIDVSASEYAFVGIEAWFDITPSPAGWIKVVAYRAGACDLCDELGGCIECAYDQRIELLSLFIGTEADKLKGELP